MRYDAVDASQAPALVDELADLYAEVYAEPPYNEGEEHVARFAQHYLDETTRAGFGLVIAVDNDLVAGAVHGWTMAAGQWFNRPITEPPAEIKNAPKFAIMEWMVRKRYRRAGIGRHLLDVILTGRPEPYAILASNPASIARRIYDKLGWHYCGSTEPAFMPSMDILALPLTPNPADLMID
jgi:GNAT superfamily N-acetyltransferase